MSATAASVWNSGDAILISGVVVAPGWSAVWGEGERTAFSLGGASAKPLLRHSHRGIIFIVERVLITCR